MINKDVETYILKKLASEELINYLELNSALNRIA